MDRSAYVLVHPEIYPSNEAANFPEGFEAENADELYGAVLSAEAARYDRRIVLLDGLAADDFDDFVDYFQCGVDPAGWEVVVAEPGELEALAIPGFDRLKRVTVAGFNRHDCVPRVARRLRRLGIDVHLHEPCTLPLTARAAAMLLSRARA